MAKRKEGSPPREKPSFQERFFEFLDQRTGNVTKHAIHQGILDLLGKLGPAVFLSRIIYWSDKGGKGDGSFYKSDREWAKELHMGRHSIIHARKLLEKAGIITTKVRRANSFPTVHYILIMQELIDAFVRFQTNGIPISDKRWLENGQTLTDTTTKNTNKKYSIRDRSQTDPDLPPSFLYFIEKNPLEKRTKESIEFFLQKYREYRGTVHPNLKWKQWQTVVDEWWQAGIFPLKVHHLNEIIPAYFEKTFQEGCNYSILHFVSGDIKKILFNEKCYYGTGEVEEE
jgi:hypothetical protein